jgi:O-antigen ligase
MLLIAALFAVVLRPRLLKGFSLAVLVAGVVIYFALPGAFSSLSGAFDPQGGLLGEQSEIVAGNPEANARLADLGPATSEFRAKPLLGRGFATTSFDPDAVVVDNQWLESALETGLLGILALLWLFGRSLTRLASAARHHDSPDGDLCLALGASLAAFGFGMLLFSAFSFAQVTYLFFVLLGLGAAKLSLLEPAPLRIVGVERGAPTPDSDGAPTISSPA